MSFITIRGKIFRASAIEGIATDGVWVSGVFHRCVRKDGLLLDPNELVKSIVAAEDKEAVGRGFHEAKGASEAS